MPDEEEMRTELASLLGRLPRVKITPDTITQPVIDDWYRRERRHRDRIAALTAERDELLTGYRFTRGQLIDALCRLEMRVHLTGPIAGKINAESMADAIIDALGGPGA